MEVLREIHNSLITCSSCTFVSRCESAFDTLSGFVSWRNPPSNERNKAWLLLAYLLREAAVFPHLNKVFSMGKVQKRITDALKQEISHESSVFLVCVSLHYPGACISHEKSLQKLAFHTLDSANSREIRRNIIDMLVLLCRAGNSWLDLAEKALNSLQNLVSSTFDSELGEIRADTLEFDTNSIVTVDDRVEILTTILTALFETAVCPGMAPKFPLNQFVRILPSLLVKTIPVGEKSLFNLHQNTCILISAIFNGLDANFLPYSKRVYSLLLDELIWAGSHSKLFETVCKTMTDLVRKFGLATGADVNFDRLVKCLKSRLVECEKSVGKVPVLSEDSMGRKKSKKARRNVEQASDLFVERRSSFRDQHVEFKSACHLLVSILRNVGPFINADPFHNVIRIVCRLAFSTASGNYTSQFFDNDSVKIDLMSVVEILITTTHPTVAPPVQLATSIFSSFSSGNPSHSVLDSAQKGTLLCLNLSRPRLPILDAILTPIIGDKIVKQNEENDEVLSIENDGNSDGNSSRDNGEIFIENEINDSEDSTHLPTRVICIDIEEENSTNNNANKEEAIKIVEKSKKKTDKTVETIAKSAIFNEMNTFPGPNLQEMLMDFKPN